MLVLIVSKAQGNPSIYAMVYDARRFILYNQSFFGASPLQIYNSALIFFSKEEQSSETIRRPAPTMGMSLTRGARRLELLSAGSRGSLRFSLGCSFLAR